MQSFPAFGFEGVAGGGALDEGVALEEGTFDDAADSGIGGSGAENGTVVVVSQIVVAPMGVSLRVRVVGGGIVVVLSCVVVR